MTDLIPPFLTIALTGTPGTGKTEVSKRLEKEGYRILHLTEFIRDYEIPSERDVNRDCDVVDMDALEEAVFEYQKQTQRNYAKHFSNSRLRLENIHSTPENLPVLFIESHMSHYLCDLAVVFRTHPNVLKIRLDERGYSDKKVMENVLAESIDIVLCDCFDYCRRIYEINTSATPVSETAECLKELAHALYDDELKKYMEMNDHAESLLRSSSGSTYEDGPPFSDIIDSIENIDGSEIIDDGAVIYEDGDNEPDYVKESNPILAKYLPGKNDWSDTVQ
jgi:Predicted nucleotide kinase (related to CMP and AMP kinases)